MADTLLVLSCLVFSSLQGTYSAPAQITIQEGTAVIDVTTNQGMGTVNDSHLVTSSSNYSTKVSGSDSNDVALKTLAGAADIVDKGDQSSVNTKNDVVDVPVVMDARIAGAKSNVMTLTDDVITDALFTNIDTIQDNLEVCEEGLRQQLRRHSHRRFIQDRAEENDDFPTDRVGLPSSRTDQDKSHDSKKNIQVDTADEGDEDNDSDDDDEIENNNETDNDEDDESHSLEMVTDTPPRPLQGKARQPRAVAGEHRGGRLSHRTDILAQKVVQRLSDRLDYLRSSLFQCHLLYKQLATL